MSKPNTIELAQSKACLEKMGIQCPEDASAASLVPQQVMAARRGLKQSGIDARPRTSSPFRAGVLWRGERQIRIIDIDGLVVLN